ncbi:MAG: gfo/Idh/MocA family oxidoreductase [Acidobacteria bacterium]|nr:MAG: gfo/Idh/MocA family oxidoreductase [Acidobacteriota bacterium]
MKKKKTSNRRQFLRCSAAAAVGGLAFPAIVPAAVFGKAGKVAPSNRVTLGCIGVGWQGGSNLKDFLEDENVQVVAVCDIDGDHLNEAKQTVDTKYGNNSCVTYHFYEELIARTDIDALSLGLPDHWHSIPAIAGAKSGKDVFGEKPLAHNWAEGRAICDAMKRYGRVWQTGSWQRSLANFRFGAELVLNGRIGKVHTVEVGLPEGHTDFAGTAGLEDPIPPPKTLDYDRWLGPAPYAPYCIARVHKNWRWNLDYAGGQLMDWVGHHVDIAHWGLGFDNTGPYEVEGYGEYPNRGRLWNTATKYRVTVKYPKDITMVVAGGYEDIQSGTKWIGDLGWVWVNRGALDANPRSLLREKFGPDEIHLYRSPGHAREFIQCVKSRGQTLAHCEAGLRSATPGFLGQIAMITGRKIRWDAEKEVILEDPGASRLLSRPMRAPWHT